MDAMYINSKPHVLLSEDRTRDGGNGERPSRQRASSEAGLHSGSVAAKSARHHHHHHHSHHPHQQRLVATSSSSLPTSSPSTPFPSFPSRPPASAATLSLQEPAFTSFSSPSVQSTPATFSSSRPGKDGHSIDSNDAGAPSAAPHTSFPPLFFGPGHNTSPETSLVGARGKSIPLDDTIAAHRTSALRELNSSFPSPVFRHRHTKSAGAKNTTYSQPVIVRTYTGPSPSPSTSAHYRPPSSSRRAGSHTAGSRRIPLKSGPVATAHEPAARSSKDAPGAGWGVKESLFGMARSKGKKGSLIPWPWGAADEPLQKEEAKLPPLEAFSFKGFMADLQTTTDIRSDLDRIAEICARSRYSLSNQYDSHVTPHGSGAGFVTAGGQPSGRTKNRRKGASNSNGPTLQAVPSDDDENNARGQRRRRGGIGGARRRSAAYGTLETIMSSSRSSEEDKTKKKSAAEIAEEVRGRAARKAVDASKSAAADETEGAEPSSGSGFRKSPRGRADRKRSPKSMEDTPEAMIEFQTSMDVANQTAPPSSRRSETTSRRQKSTSFAHAVMGSSRYQHSQSGRVDNGVPSDPTVGVPAAAVSALLSEPALPQTSGDFMEIHERADLTDYRNLPPDTTIPSRPAYHLGRNGSNTEPTVHIVGVDNGTGDELVPFSASEDAASAGFLSGLTHWIPWMAAGNGPAAGHWTGEHNQTQNLNTANHRTIALSPDRAEGSLRELLKSVDAGKQSKGKAVDRDD